jgi:hypothetical protein
MAVNRFEVYLINLDPTVTTCILAKTRSIRDEFAELGLPNGGFSPVL